MALPVIKADTRHKSTWTMTIFSQTHLFTCTCLWISDACMSQGTNSTGKVSIELLMSAHICWVYIHMNVNNVKYSWTLSTRSSNSLPACSINEHFFTKQLIWYSKQHLSGPTWVYDFMHSGASRLWFPLFILCFSALLHINVQCTQLGLGHLFEIQPDTVQITNSQFCHLPSCAKLLAQGQS